MYALVLFPITVRLNSIVLYDQTTFWTILLSLLRFVRIIRITRIIETKGFKFVETLKVTFVKRKDNTNIYKRAQRVINSNDFLSSLGLSQQQLLNGIGVWLSDGSGWTITSIDEHYINTVADLQHSRQGLVNMKNEDNESFRWCLIRYLNPQEKDPQRIEKSDTKMIK